MSNVHTFAPRRPVSPPMERDIPSPAEVRRQIEEAAQSALDIADRLIMLLDQIESDPNQEDGGDAKPSLGVPENHHASQVVWLRGSSFEIEQDAAQWKPV